jgi:hypothetical protein
MATTSLFRLTPQNAALVKQAGKDSLAVTFGNAPVSNLPWMLINGVSKGFIEPYHGRLLAVAVAAGKTITVVEDKHGTHTYQT